MVVYGTPYPRNPPWQKFGYQFVINNLDWVKVRFYIQAIDMGSSVLIICFVVVVIGGIGSITGALVASLLVGFVDTFGKVFFAEWSGVGVYVLMAIVLVWRPEGLVKRGF